MAGLPPLMPGWTEHIGPEGQLYWYNDSLQQSTYNRPTSQPPGFSGQFGGQIPTYTGPPPFFVVSDPSLSDPSQAGPSSYNGNVPPPKSKTRKEKPAQKDNIPGAPGWLRVTTTLGNIFYTHVETKRSEWTVPDEIKEHVDAMEDEERRVRALEEEEERLAREQEEEEQRQVKEQERLRKLEEEEKERKRRQEELRIREEAVKKQRQERERIQEERLKILQEQGKRKREEEQEEGSENGAKMEEAEKKIRVSDDREDEDEEAWQREMAAEMAEEAELVDHEDWTPSGPSNVVLPDPQAEQSKAELSIEEAKALFSHMLSSLNGTPDEINPMAPWDRELPKFIHQRDYTVLSSLRDRQDAFNEWCRIKLREKRNKGTKQAAPISEESAASPLARAGSDGAGASNETAGSNALKVFQTLLKDEVKSTRTKWEDFRKAWKKDRRFFAFGRDDREREKVFRTFLKELGEKKRKAAERSEEDFKLLLEESLGDEHRLDNDASTEQVHTTWSKAKRTPVLDKDVRYEQVGSSSRRAELFGEWAKGQTKRQDRNGDSRIDQDETSSSQRDKRAKDAERALREREEAVHKQRRETEIEKRKAFGNATRGESSTNFQQLLVDAIRDPLLSLSEVFRMLSSDGRFDAPGLRTADKEHLIQQHLNSLNEKRLLELQAIFAKYAPSLDVDAEVALPLIKDDDEIERRKLDQIRVVITNKKTMADLFQEWRIKSEDEASMAFQQMLKENAFVNFWGRLRQEHEQRQKEKKTSVNGGVGGSGGRQGEDEEDDDEPDLLQMAGNVDLEEIHSILRNDQRYRAFRHRPQQREEWIRNHLQTMSVPKKTVFQRD